MPQYEFEEFCYGEILSQKIDFLIDDHSFCMIFTPVSAVSNEELLQVRADEVGFIIPQNSYDVKFDRLENLDMDSPYAAPAAHFSNMTLDKMARLGSEIIYLLTLHADMLKAEVYFAVAANKRLRIFYDKLVLMYAPAIKFDVTKFGQDEVCYALKTAYYCDSSREN